MTRSSNKELFTPFESPKQEFRSSRKLFKTPGLDESSSPKFDLFSDLEENSKEEVAERMAKTMEQYMSKTRADYGLGVTMPKIDDKYHFELKGQFLKELRDNTFSSSNHEDANEHIEKVFEIDDLFHIPIITQDQIMLRAFLMSLTGAQEPDETIYQSWERLKELLMKCPRHYLTEIQEVILFYNGLEVLTRQILDSKGAIPTKTVVDAKVSIQKMAEYSQKWLNETSRTRSTETSDGLAAIQAQLNNLGREIKKVNEKVYAAQVGCELCKGPHYTKDCPLKEEGKTIEEAYYTQFGVPFQQGGQYRATTLGFYQRNNGLYGLKVLDAYSIGTTLQNDSLPKKEKYPGSFTLPCYINNVCFEKAFADLGAIVSVMPLSTYLNLDFIILDMPEDVNVPLILGRPFLYTVHAKVDVFKRKITLSVGDEKIIFKSVKPASSLIKRVYMLSLR
nr:hypothetical protein [Tanacetum cinerariifolium]